MDFWSGRQYELNMSFSTLRDNQWLRLLEALWNHDAITGPLSTRFVPNETQPAMSTIRHPAPTATFTQHGILHLNEQAFGLDILVTRSLFECVSLIVSEGMLANASDSLEKDYYLLSTLQTLYKSLALHIFQAVPFEIAVIGWDRDCQLPSELLVDETVRAQFLKTGNFLIQENVLRQLGLNTDDYPEPLPGLRWSPDKSST